MPDAQKLIAEERLRSDLAALSRPVGGEEDEKWPAHWGEDEKMRDLHARYHDSPGNFLGPDDCSWSDCAFWEAVSFARAESVRFSRPVGGETEYRAHLGPVEGESRVSPEHAVKAFQEALDAYPWVFEGDDQAPTVYSRQVTLWTPVSPEQDGGKP